MYWCVPWISSAASREETNLHGREPGEVHLQSSQGVETLGQISLGCIQLGDVSNRKSVNQRESILANHLDQFFRMRRLFFDFNDASKQIVNRLLGFLNIVLCRATNLRLISHLSNQTTHQKEPFA